MRKERPIHATHPTEEYAHPFKAWTLCRRLVRFGGIEYEGRIVTCKLCLRISENEKKEKLTT